MTAPPRRLTAPTALHQRYLLRGNAMRKHPITGLQPRLREIFSYDADIGRFRWKTNRPRGVMAGDIAGSFNPATGYRRVSLDGVRHWEHRLIWVFHNGDIGKAEIDHIDGDRTNNKIENLRLSDRSTNLQNQSATRKSRSGLLGVSWNKSGRKWRAVICLNQRRIYLGLYSTPQEAHQAYLTAKSKLHKANPVPRS